MDRSSMDCDRDGRHRSNIARSSHSAIRDPTTQLVDDANQVDQSADLTAGGSGIVVDTQYARSASPLQGLLPVVIYDETLGSTDTLSLSARQPLSGPGMLSVAPALLDFKLRFQGEVLVHYEFVGYRSEYDTTVSSSKLDHNALMLIRADSDLFQVQCFAFSSYKFSAVSFVPSIRLYTCTAGDEILSPDVPNIYLEVRGSDEVEVEFRYREGREFLLVCNRLRAAEFEAKQRTKQAQIATAEVDIQELLLSHVPIQAPPTLAHLSSICIGDLPVVHESLVFLHLVKIKAVRAFESALTGKGQLLQVSPQIHLQYKSEEVSRRLVMRATEICDIFSATIDVSRALIDQVEMAPLPLATQIEQAYGLPETGVRPDALGQAQMPVLLDEKVYGYEGSGPWSVTTTLILLPQ